jgi:hypothetical protein
LLNTYIAQVQDLLHDPLAQLWPVASLTNYINEARNRVAQDTKCLRQVLTTANFPTLTLNQGQELYPLATYLPAPYNLSLVDVMGIAVNVNNERYKMKYWAYTQIDAFLRGWVNYQDWPIVFSRVGGNSYIFVAPVPNQTYNCEWDISYNPQPLASDSDPEPIAVPFQEPVQYYAAYKAKLKIQAQGEAKYFLDLYDEIKRRCTRAWMYRIIPNPYATMPR